MELTSVKTSYVETRIFTEKVQGDHKVSVHPMITIVPLLAQFDCWAADRQG
jgi:hypothetical protein